MPCALLPDPAIVAPAAPATNLSPFLSRTIIPAVRYSYRWDAIISCLQHECLQTICDLSYKLEFADPRRLLSIVVWNTRYVGLEVAFRSEICNSLIFLSTVMFLGWEGSLYSGSCKKSKQKTFLKMSRRGNTLCAREVSIRLFELWCNKSRRGKYTDGCDKRTVA